MKTADLINAHASELRLIHLPFRRFGAKPHFCGQAQTIKCFEDNTLIRSELEQPGKGRVLIVDGSGSTRWIFSFLRWAHRLPKAPRTDWAKSAHPLKLAAQHCLREHGFMAMLAPLWRI